MPHLSELKATSVALMVTTEPAVSVKSFLRGADRHLPVGDVGLPVGHRGLTFVEPGLAGVEPALPLVETRLAFVQARLALGAAGGRRVEVLQGLVALARQGLHRLLARREVVTQAVALNDHPIQSVVDLRVLVGRGRVRRADRDSGASAEGHESDCGDDEIPAPRACGPGRLGRRVDGFDRRRIECRTGRVFGRGPAMGRVERHGAPRGRSCGFRSIERLTRTLGTTSDIAGEHP
ncbi:hypothetical protein CZ771_06055 [Actinomycetales bacterium JB111]|nr:hypothetical protein CZ771_06055 [Actinomycetales bacterium JB111]